MTLSVRARSVVLTAMMLIIVALPCVMSNEVLRLDTQVVMENGGTRLGAHLRLTASTVARSLLAFGICWVACVVVAAILVMWKAPVAAAFEAIVSAMRFLPAVAWLPLQVATIGQLGWTAQLAFVSFGVVPLVSFHLLHGFRRCDREKLILARLVGASRWRTFVGIVAPNARHEIFHSQRVGLGMSFVLVVVYEYVFPHVGGVARIVDLLNLARYPVSDAALFTMLLLCLGLLLDQAAVLARDAVTRILWPGSVTVP
jgi:ABC-type nitrate/sulfonate/bicarbonate transport system permease component